MVSEGISLRLKGRVCKTTVRAVLLYGSETWLLQVEDLRRLQVFDSRCLRNIAGVGRCQRIRNETVRKRVFGYVEGTSIGDCISVCTRKFCSPCLTQSSGGLKVVRVWLGKRVWNLWRRAWDQWVRVGFLNGVRATLPMHGSKLCKIWLLTGVSSACAVNLYPDRLTECLEV